MFTVMTWNLENFERPAASAAEAARDRLARPRPAASRHSARHRIDRRPCSPAVRDVEAGCGRGWDAAALTFLLTTWPIITKPAAHALSNHLPGPNTRRRDGAAGG